MSGDVPEGWDLAPIGELLESTQYGINQSLSSDAPGIPVLRMGNIQDFRLDLGDLKYAELAAETADRYLVRRNDILFNRTNSLDLVGKVAIVDTDDVLSFSSYVVRLRALRSRADPVWLFYSLASARQQNRLRAIATPGVSQANINPTKMQLLSLTVPPLPEQRKIAEVLNTVDDAIQATEAVIEQTKKVKHGVMNQLLTKGIGHTRFKQTEIGEIPEEWAVVELQDTVSGIRYGTSAKSASEPAGTPILRIPNVLSERINTIDLKYTELSVSDRHRYDLSDGDVLIVRTNGNPDYIGRSGLVTGAYTEFSFASYLMRLRPTPDLLSGRFLHAFLNTNRARAMLFESAATSAGNYNINAKSLGKLSLALPPLDEQVRIADRIGQLTTKLNISQQELDQLLALKTGVMSDLLTGRKRVESNFGEGKRRD